MDKREQRAREIQDSIREVLLRDWDPIRVHDIPEAQDEYDSYVGMVYRLLAEGSSEEEVFQHLFKIQISTMEMTVSDQTHLRNVANELMRLDVSLHN